MSYLLSKLVAHLTHTFVTWLLADYLIIAREKKQLTNSKKKEEVNASVSTQNTPQH